MPWSVEWNGEWRWTEEQIAFTEEEPRVILACARCGEQDIEERMMRGMLFPRSSRALVWLCDSCVRTCQHCDSYFATINSWYHDDCPNCYDDDSDCNDDDDGGFYYAPCRFFGNGPKYFGLEIETEVKSGHNRGDKLRELRSLLGTYASLKDDGSLDYGIEIATNPASIVEHKARLGKLFAAIPNGLRSWRAQSTGLHVHVSRSPLSDLCIAKTVCFVSANHNRRFIALIAGRDSNSYCKILPKKMGSAAQYNDDRYEAVNLQNDNTIEFRLFKGTLRQASVFKALEFTDALTTYAGKAARSIKDSQSRVKFCAFVEENATTWPNLCAFIQARWFGRETDLTKQIGYDARENSQENYNQTEEN